MTKGRLAFASSLLMLLGILVAGCGNPTPSNPPGVQQSYNYVTPAHKGGTLIESDWQSPESLNNWFSSSVVDVEVENAIWGAPIVITSDAKLAPDQVIEVPSQANGDVSKDGLTVTWKLRHDLKWNDGQPITSADYIYWLKTLLDPATAAQSTAGYDAQTLASYTAPDQYTVVMKYVKVFSSFLFYPPYAAPQHAWGSIPDNALANTPDVNVAPKITSGAFKIADFASGGTYTLVPNPYFKSTTLHPTVLDKLVFKPFADKDALIAGFQASETDYATDFTPGDLQKLSSIPGLQTTAQIFSEHLDFNLENPVLQDVNVRRAIAYAIDRCQIITSILHENCKTGFTESLTPPPAPTYDTSIKGYPFSVAKAKDALKAAGWDCSSSPCTKGGQPFPTLRLATTANNQLRADTIQLMKDDLTAVGIPVSIDGQLYPNGSFFGDFASGGILATGKYDLAEFAYQYPLDAYASLTYFQSTQIPTTANPSGGNYERVNDPKIDQYLDQGVSEVDFGKRTTIFKNLLTYVSEQMYELPLYIRPNINLVSSKIGNYFPNPTSQGNQWNVGDWYVKAAS